jgi:CRISPR/Cas system-associated endonuclease Cas1
MIKRTVLFTTPAYLSMRYEQLVVKPKEGDEVTIPIEDIGVLVLGYWKTWKSRSRNRHSRNCLPTM